MFIWRSIDFSMARLYIAIGFTGYVELMRLVGTWSI